MDPDTSTVLVFKAVMFVICCYFVWKIIKDSK